MAKAKVKSKATVFPAPRNREEVVALIGALGGAQRERERLRLEMDEQITKLRERFDQLMTPYVDEIKVASAAIQLWCEAHRAELTQDGKVKTVNLMTGEVRWRNPPPSCKAIRVKEAIEEVKAHGHQELFLRVKEELNKEAILAQPELITGYKWLTIVQDEDFVIVPFETELEEVA